MLKKCELTNIEDVEDNGNGKSFTKQPDRFLWVQLQVDLLCRNKSELGIREVLQHGLTGSLDKIYRQTIDSMMEMDPVSRDIAQRVFSWLLFSKEPLTVGVTSSAVAWGLDDPNQDSDTVSRDLICLCLDLILVDSVTNALTFCHPSVRDFLIHHEMFSPAASHHVLATACLQQCMAGADLACSAVNSSPITEFYQYAALYWNHHVREALNDNQLTEAITRFIFEEDDITPSFSFVVWLDWVYAARDDLPRYDERRRGLASLSSNESAPLFVASILGIPSILEYMLSSTEYVNLEIGDEKGRTSLYLASAFGHGSLVSKLISHKAEVNCKGGDYGSPLQVACFRGHLDVVQTLLQNGARPWEEAAFKNALEATFLGNNEDVAMLLVKCESMIQTSEQYEFALCGSAEVGFLAVFDWLSTPKVGKSLGKELGDEDRRKGALRGIIKNGHVHLLKSFLKSNSDGIFLLPNDAVSIAAAHGHADMIVFLHDLGINMELEGPHGFPLRAAALAGRERAVRVLVELGSDVRETGTQGDALQAAASKGHTQIMQYLIAEGAQVNQFREPWGTCLQVAAYHGYHDAVRLLLDAGADMYQQGKYEDALCAALQGGHESIASLLLSEGYSLTRAFIMSTTRILCRRMHTHGTRSVGPGRLGRM